MEHSTLTSTPDNTDRGAWQALLVWGIFIVLLVILNATIAFALGADLHAWTHSQAKAILFDLIIYAGLFLVVPLILTKGWKTVRQPAFLLPLLIAVIGIGLQPFVHPAPILALLVLVYLHWRFDLSDLGIRSRGWKGDIVAILLMGLLSLVPVLFPGPHPFTPGNAALAAIDRRPGISGYRCPFLSLAVYWKQEGMKRRSPSLNKPSNSLRPFLQRSTSIACSLF